jgi:hypothetical protein
MSKLYSILGVFALAGCAASATDPVSLAAAHARGGAPPAAQAKPTDAAAKVIDMATLENEQKCHGVTRPGTRIVVAQRCEPIDEEALVHTLNQVRRDQETLDRLAREREGRRRESF